MPPKKGKKKQVDDWEAELGESLEDPPQVETDEPSAESTQATKPDEDEDDGGLMSQLGKSKKVGLKV